MATRYCFNDYDREIGIVGEVQRDGQRTFVGVGRLISDPDHATAEYAVLVADRWQNQGIGTQLTKYCMEIAESWQLRQVTAIVGPGNWRMRRIFEGLGFDIDRDTEADVVFARKELAGSVVV